MLTISVLTVGLRRVRSDPPYHLKYMASFVLIWKTEVAESEIAEGSAEHGSWQALDNCECCEASCYTRCIAFVCKCGEWSHHLAGIIASTCEFVNYVRRPCGMESFTLKMFLTMIYFLPCCNLPRGPRFFLQNSGMPKSFSYCVTHSDKQFTPAQGCLKL